MSSHGVPRIERDRSPEQLKKDLEKIDKYRALESQLRAQTPESRFDSATLELTTKLLRINPEYYTVWNARRRCLVSGPLKREDKRPLPKDASERHDTGDSPIDAPQSLPQTDSSDSELTRRRLATGQGHTEKDREQDDSDGDNTRKKTSEVIRDELTFTVPLLMAHPKCYWIWNYRMWTLEQATSLLPAEIAKSIWQEELRLVTKMLERDRRNYHAWAYRRYVVSHLESTKLQGQSMAESEFAYTTKMIGSDLSNFSAWHNRAQLIPRLLVEREANDTSRRAFLDQEFSMVDNGLNVGPDDQSLWYYHQYLNLNVTELPENLAIVPGMLVEDRAKVLSREIDFIKDLLEDYKDVKWIFEMLLEYTLLLHKLRNQPVSSEQKSELETWVASIKKLDPQRSNRWRELAEELDVSQ
ncbi:protein prenyltransferase [Cordyceps fumosorosea ARSEF 2679]|uniref:Geranylgeranyl transferase type-2 subunit alpha n=1 Tax=Cordyceps fumosorosea (strain ARSEF 2679) TaxID=1081104 RepID=A0A167RRJ5_CORFA|nr:protein prenyltransferase [Cordyceps fumosorosea ARSEF 2679]OAA58861.1 protein prenyltransferase [Cordyceps fumosorosea ARSEF 2679]